MDEVIYTGTLDGHHESRVCKMSPVAVEAPKELLLKHEIIWRNITDTSGGFLIQTTNYIGMFNIVTF